MIRPHCKYTHFSSTYFLRFPVFQPSTGILPASGYSGIHEVVHCYIDLAQLCDLPYFAVKVIHHIENLKASVVHHA